jgi:VanZ family protein
VALAAWIVAVACVTTFSLLPAFAPSGEYGFDKMIHAATYLSLALLPHAGFETRKAALAAAFTMIPLGCAIEVAQAFVPGRYGDIWDVAANSTGALAGMALGARFRQIVGAVTRVAR